MVVIALDLTSAHFDNGRPFGAVGAYELLSGTATFSLDPTHPRNTVVTDLELADRESDGRVQFSADVRILRPADPARGNRGLVLDVANRGTPVALRQLETRTRPVTGQPELPVADGWLLERGYTIVCCGWQPGLPAGRGLIRAVLPQVSVTGGVRSVQEPDLATRVLPLGDPVGALVHRGYPPVDLEEPGATLVEREAFFAPARTIPRRALAVGGSQTGRFLRHFVYLGTVTKDQHAAVTLLEGAGLDVLADPASRDINRLSQDPNYRAVPNDRTGQYFDVIFNCTKPPTDDKLFRQSVNYAIDRQRLADTILAGTSKSRTLPWPAQAPAYEASKANAYAFDLDKARTLLAQSGVSNPQIDIVAQAGLDALQQMAQVLPSDLAKIGVRSTVKPMEFGAMGTTIRDKTFLGIVLFQSGFAQLESSSLFTTGGTWNYQNNNAGFADDTYKALVTQVSGEPNSARRKQLYSQLNDLLLDQAFTLALASNTPYLLARGKVQGLGWFASEAPSLGDAWLAS